MYLNRVYGHIPNPRRAKMSSFTYTIYFLTTCSVSMVKLPSLSYSCMFLTFQNFLEICYKTTNWGMTVSQPSAHSNTEPCDKTLIRAGLSLWGIFCLDQQWTETCFKWEWRKLKQEGAEINENYKASGKSHDVQPFWNWATSAGIWQV